MIQAPRLTQKGCLKENGHVKNCLVITPQTVSYQSVRIALQIHRD
jgi:hypothetical protein